jgi:sigma-B regulation protein RsbU (phosphoserine phosphatase)
MMTVGSDQTELLLLQSAVESAGEAIIITDLDGTIRYVNPAFERITQYSRKEAIGRNPRILKSGKQDSELYRDLWRTIASGTAWRGSFFNRKKDGTLYHVEQTIAPVLDSVGNAIAYVSVHADVTQRKRLEAIVREGEVRRAREESEQQLREAQKEFEIARRVQQQMFPRAAPDIPGFDIAGSTFPIEATSGDYYDFIPLCDGTLGIVVADVSGHGLGPALVMAETRAYLRALARSNSDIVEILNHANSLLTDKERTDRFVTLLMVRLDCTSRTVVHAGAGHEGYHIDCDGRARKLASTGLPLGVTTEFEIDAGPNTPLEPGDLLLLTTDGLHETRCDSDEFFQVERMLDLVAQHRDQPARTIVDQLYAASRMFAGQRPQSDDVTIVVVKVLDP